MKSFKYLIILFFLVECGYTPVYQSVKTSKLKLDNINYSGDTKISRLILNNLQGFKDGNSNNIFDAYYISEKKEEIVSKDKKGNPSSYKIQIEVNLELISKNNDKKFSKKFAKETTYNSIDNNFELNKYKKKLEKNLTSQILQDMNNFFDIVGNDC